MLQGSKWLSMLSGDPALAYGSASSRDFALHGWPGDFYTDELAMESQQSAAEHATMETDQDITQAREQQDASRTPPKDKSTLAQVVLQKP